MASLQIASFVCTGAQSLSDLAEKLATAAMRNGVDPRKLLGSVETKDSTICQCERGEESQRVNCFLNEYRRFQARRRTPLTGPQLRALELVQSVSELILIDEQVTDGTPLQDYLQSLVLQEFLRCHGLRHPSFSREMPPLRKLPLLRHFEEL